MTFGEVFDEFMLDKCAQGLADKSLESYRNILHIFLEYVGKNTEIASIDLNCVQKYSIEIKAWKLSKATHSTYMRNVKIFLNWIHEVYGLPFDPKRIKVQNTPKKKAM